MTKEDFDEIEELISAAGHAVCFAKKHNREGSPREQIEAELAKAKILIVDAYKAIRECQDDMSIHRVAINDWQVKLPWFRRRVEINVTTKNEDDDGKTN